MTDPEPQPSDVDASLPEANRPSDPLQVGIALAAQGKWAAAIAAFDLAIRRNPHEAEPYYRRGLARFDAGDAAAAAFDHTRALELWPEHPQAPYARALARLTLKHFPGALSDVDSLLVRQPVHPAAHQLRGMVLRKQGNLPEAIAAFRRAAEQYLARKDAEAARQCLALAEQLRPQFTGAIAPTAPPTPTSWADTVATWLQRIQQASPLSAPEASQVLKAAEWTLSLDGADGQARLLRGAARSALGNWSGAIEDLNRAINLASVSVGNDSPFPKSYQATVQRYRGKAKAAAGDLAGARADLDAAIALDPDQAVLWLERARLRHDTGDEMGAIADAGEALSRQAEFVPALLLRGEAYARLEETRQAAENYQAAATACCQAEDWEGYRNALDRLKQLHQAMPAAAANAAPTENPLRQRLRILVGGQWPLAERLIDQAKADYPGMGEDWYLEKVIYDIESDRHDDDD